MTTATKIKLTSIQNPSRFTFEDAQDHIYTLVKNDSYVRFLRSDDYAMALRHALEKQNTQGGTKTRRLFKTLAPTPQPATKPVTQKPPGQYYNFS